MTAAVRIDSDCCQNFDKVQHTTVSRIALTEKYAKNLFLLTCFCWWSQGQKKVEKCVTTYSSLTDNVFVDPQLFNSCIIKTAKKSITFHLPYLKFIFYKNIARKVFATKILIFQCPRSEKEFLHFKDWPAMISVLITVIFVYVILQVDQGGNFFF